MNPQPPVTAGLLLGAMGALSGIYLAAHEGAVYAAWDGFVRVVAALGILLHCFSFS